MLHRGEYAIESEHTPEDDAVVLETDKWNWKDVLGFRKGFSFADKATFFFVYFYLLANMLAIMVMTVWHFAFGTTDRIWLRFWHYYVWFNFFLVLGIIIWFSLGGLKDLKDLYRRLKTAIRDETDDGTVEHAED
jgi:SSS family solute:Na+ symporter